MTDHFAAHASLLKAKQDGKPPDPVDINEPIPGWYRGSVYKTGPLLPIIITRELDPEWGSYTTRAFHGGLEVPVDRVWPYCVHNPVPKDWHDTYMRNGGWPDVEYADHARMMVGGGVQRHVDVPVPGWYRGTARRGGPLVPIVIAPVEGGGFECRVNGQTCDIDRYWPYCSGKPVSEEWYRHFMEKGHWPDVHQVADATEHLEALKCQREAIGGNNPTLIEVLRDQIEAAAAGVKDYTDSPILHAVTAGAAASLLDRMRKLEGEADEARKKEKDPHLLECRKTDDKWRPVIGAATDAKKALLTALEGYKPPTAAAGERVAIKGGSGRTVVITEITEVDEVTDWPALFLCLQANEDLRELMIKLANKALAVGATVPGVKTKIRRKGK